MAKLKRVKTGKRAPPARRRARAADERAIEAALAGLAHDIRTPLTGILALAELLHATDLPEREHHWAGAIKAAAEHLARLTTLVVDAAKAEAAGLVLRDEPFSPRELAAALGASLAGRAESKGLAFEVSIGEKMPARVRGDVIRLRSALENLIDNAVKFTERGRITLAVAASPARGGRVRLRFAVTDTGIGITPADLKRLFRPFSQANESVARRYGGAGLGLALVKRIATAMGGTLAVTSKPGQGSTFRLDVVMHKDRPGDPLAGGASARAPRGLRVLSVEDNPYGRVVLNAVLGELGHHVSFVGSGEQAVETLARGEHDAVFMDIELNGIDGIEATRRIRALPTPFGAVPIIGLSGRSDRNDEAQALRAGMNRYLRKPASPAVLHEILSDISAQRP